jgi:hypothetical protein
MGNVLTEKGHLVKLGGGGPGPPGSPGSYAPAQKLFQTCKQTVRDKFVIRILSFRYQAMFALLVLSYCKQVFKNLLSQY